MQSSRQGICIYITWDLRQLLSRNKGLRAEAAGGWIMVVCIYQIFIFNYSDTGYVCMIFHKRDGHVIEVQQSSKFNLIFNLHIFHCTHCMPESRAWFIMKIVMRIVRDICSFGKIKLQLYTKHSIFRSKDDYAPWGLLSWRSVEAAVRNIDKWVTFQPYRYS